MKKIISLFMLIIVLTVHAVYAAPDKEQNKETIGKVLDAAYEHLKITEAEYSALSEKYNMSKPFSKMAERQKKYIDMLVQLYTQYELKAPEKDWGTLIEIPDSYTEYYKNAILKEQNISKKYISFIKEEKLPHEVIGALHKLMELSAHNTRFYKFILESKAKNDKDTFDYLP